MAVEVEVLVRCPGHGTVHARREEDPAVVRSGSGDRTEALKLLDAMVTTVREELGAPPVAASDGPDEGWLWMRDTLREVAAVLGMPAPFRPFGGERDRVWGTDLVIRVRDTRDGATPPMFLRGLDELGDWAAELGLNLPADSSPVSILNRIREALRGRPDPVAQAVAYVREAAEAERLRAEQTAAAVAALADGIPPGHTRQVYTEVVAEAAALVRERLVDGVPAVPVEPPFERVAPDFREALRKLAEAADVVPEPGAFMASTLDAIRKSLPQRPFVEEYLTLRDMVAVRREDAIGSGLVPETSTARVFDGDDVVAVTAGRPDVAGMPVILDSAQPHETFSLRAPRARGAITPGGPLDLGDVTTVAEVSRALSRFDHMFQVTTMSGRDDGAELRSLPGRLHELMDEADRLRGLPARRTLELANTLGLSRERRNGLFRGKEEPDRWDAVLRLVSALNYVVGRVRGFVSALAEAQPSTLPDGASPADLSDPDVLADAVDWITKRLVVLERAAADELGDPAVQALAGWLRYAVEQAEEKTGVSTADAVGAAEWPVFLSTVAEYVLLCAAGVRQTAAEKAPEVLTVEKLADLVDAALRAEKPDSWWIDGDRLGDHVDMCRGIATRLLAEVGAVGPCPSVSRGAKVPCGGRHRHESADGSLVWNDDEEPYTPQAVRDLEHELDLRTEALIRALKLTEDERTAMRSDAGDNVFRQWEYALTLAASARKATSTYGLTGGMSDDLTAHLALPSIELRELRERLDQAAPVDRWRLALDVVQQRCAAFASIKSLVQPWNGAMTRPEQVTEAVRRLAEEKRAIQLAEDGPVDRQTLRDRVIGHTSYLAQMAGLSPERASGLGYEVAERVLAGPVDQEEVHTGLLDLKATTLENEIANDEIARQSLIGDRRWFASGSPAPGPEVLAVRQIRDLDPGDGGGVSDLLYVRVGDDSWAEVRAGVTWPVVWRWSTVDAVALVDCSDEVAHHVVGEAAGFAVEHRLSGRHFEWSGDRDVAEAEAKRRNDEARSALLGEG